MHRPVLLALLVTTLIAADAPDLFGARRALAPVPPPGTHPRVLFSPGELPALAERLNSTTFGKVIGPKARASVERHRGLLVELAALREPGAAEVERLWVPDDARNQAFALAAILGLGGDDELAALAGRAAAGYARLVLAARTLGAGGQLKVLAGRVGGSGGARVWDSPIWDLNTAWVCGGAGLALTYDLLYDRLDPADRQVLHDAIAAATRGRRSWSLGAPANRAVSNHCLYPANLAVMLLAIEGEEGFDEEVWNLWVRMFGDYLERGIYASGASNEDTYALGTSLREGSMAMVAMARRGHDFFAHPHWRAFLPWVAQAIEPIADGTVQGHGGGSSNGYPAFWITARFMFPDSPLTSHLWRWYAGPDYTRNIRWQSMLEQVLFACDWDPALPATVGRGALGLPLLASYPERGLVIARSDWSAEALYMQADARTDAFLVGHDNADRGTFTLAALGRPWAIDGDWMGFKHADEHSQVRIDGQGQEWKPPGVRLLPAADGGTVAQAGADLTYAYNWQWNPAEPWAGAETVLPPPWEPERSDPRALGMPDLPWLPHTLYGVPDTGYVGLYQWRRPIGPVAHAFRTWLLGRGAQPWLLVADDVRKDDAEHGYDWLLQLAGDLTITVRGEREVILGSEDASDGRRLLVREVSTAAAPSAWSVESYLGRSRPGKGSDKGRQLPGKRLVVTRRGVEAGFRFLLVPLRPGEQPPATVWDGATLRIAAGSQEHRLTCTVAPDGRSRWSVVAP